MEPWEAAVIRKMDAVFCEAVAAHIAAKIDGGTAPGPKTAPREMTPELFDAVFG